MKTIKNKTLSRLVTIVIVLPFLCQNILLADSYSLPNGKLAARSRWTAYWNDSKHQLDETCMDAFIYATRKIEKEIEEYLKEGNIGDPGFHERLFSAIDKVNEQLQEYGARSGYTMSITRPEREIPTVQLLKKYKRKKAGGNIVDVPYLVFNFGRENPKKRVVVFNLEPDKLSIEAQREIGIKNKRDLGWLKIPGTERVWIMGDGEISNRLLKSTMPISMEDKDKRFLIASKEAIQTSVDSLKDAPACKNAARAAKLTEGYLTKLTTAWLEGMSDMSLPIVPSEFLSYDTTFSPLNISTARFDKDKAIEFINWKLRDFFGDDSPLITPEQIVIVKYVYGAKMEGVSAKAFPLIGRFVIEEEVLAKQESLEWILIHEALHILFPGFVNQNLDESVTDWLTSLILGRQPFGQYSNSASALKQLIDETNIRKLLIDAYKTGNASKLRKAIGDDNFLILNNLSLFEFVGAIRSNLRSPDIFKILKKKLEIQRRINFLKLDKYNEEEIDEEQYETLIAQLNKLNAAIEELLSIRLFRHGQIGLSDLSTDLTGIIEKSLTTAIPEDRPLPLDIKKGDVWLPPHLQEQRIEPKTLDINIYRIIDIIQSELARHGFPYSVFLIGSSVIGKEDADIDIMISEKIHDRHRSDLANLRDSLRERLQKELSLSEIQTRDVLILLRDEMQVLENTIHNYGRVFRIKYNSVFQISSKMERIPNGSPATLLRYMSSNKVFSDNPKRSIELARQRGGNDSRRTIQRELRVLKVGGLVEGSPKTGYYLPDWLRDVNIEDIITENPELNLPNANNEQIKTIAERIMVDKDLERIEQLITEVAANLNGRQTSANQRYGNNIETRKAEIIDLLRNYTIEVVINFLTVLKTYLNNEIPDASLFRGFDLILLNNLPASTERFHLWTTQAIEEFSTHLDAKIDKVRERTGKEPVVIEVAAGYADLSYGLKRLMASVRIIPTDGFHLQEGEDKDYDPKTIQSRGVRKLRVADVESGTFRKQLDIPEDTPVIIIASQLPLKGDVEKSLFNQAHVDELILITAYEPRSHKKGSGQEDIVANDKVWVVKSQSLNTRIWFSGVPSLEGRLKLELETFSRIPDYPSDEHGAISNPSVPRSEASVLEIADRMERRDTKTYGELIDSRKKPINYKFPRRKPAKIPTWQQLQEAETVSANDFLNLLSDYIGAGLPNLSVLINIYEKISFTLDEAWEYLEILERHTEAKHYVTAAENRKIKAYFEGRLAQDYPDLQKTPQESNLRETIERNKKDAELAKELLNNIVPATLKKDRIYEIRYDASRLSESQQGIIETYIRLLKGRVANPDNIAAIPFKDIKRDYIIKVTCKNGDRQTIGEGQVNVDIEDEVGGYPLRIIGMLNIAFAAANVPDKLTSNQLEEYRPLISFIQNQYKSITGGELTLSDSVEEMLKVIRKIELPKPEKIELDEANRLNRIARQLLTSA